MRVDGGGDQVIFIIHNTSYGYLQTQTLRKLGLKGSECYLNTKQPNNGESHYVKFCNNGCTTVTQHTTAGDS